MTATLPERPPPKSSPPRDPQILGLPGRKIPFYERFAGVLITLLLLFGVAACCLFIIWLFSRVNTSTVAVPVMIENITGGRADGVLNESMQIDAPDREEIAKEAEFDEPQVQDTVEMIADTLALKAADLDDPALTEELESGAQSGKSTGTGNAYALGEGDGDTGGVPRGLRWRIVFDNTSLVNYARQLDHFGIELGVLQPGRVDYASGLSRATPTRRSSQQGEAESRLYFSWEGGTLKQYDLQLLSKAGINASGRVAVQFFPPEVENMLAALEQRHANRRPEQIRRTNFAVRPSGSGFEFYVVSQEGL